MKNLTKVLVITITKLVNTINELTGATWLVDGDIVYCTFDARYFVYLNATWVEIGTPIYVVNTPAQLPVSVAQHVMARTTEGVYAGRMYIRNEDNTGWVSLNFLSDPILDA